MFDEVSLPIKYAYGSTGGPGFSTSIIVNPDSAQEQRIARRNQPQHRFDLSASVRSLEDLATIRDFVNARRGPARGWRLKCREEYSSAAVGSSDPGVRDVLIGTGDASETQFQLFKPYTSGLVTVNWTVRKPIAGTVRVWVNAVEQTSGVHFTVDTTTGVVTFTAAPGNGLDVEASFEFEYPVRFGKEIDEVFSISREDVESGNIPEIPAVEIMSGTTGYSELPMGGAYELSIGANFTVAPGLGHNWHVATTAAGLKAIMIDPAELPTGGPICRVFNDGANTFTLTDHNDATLATLTVGTMVDVFLAVDAVGARVYYAA